MLFLGGLIFSADDVLWFANASGDFNPIHIDPIAARRSIAGKQVVHGVFTVLSALELFYQRRQEVPRRLKVYFSKPVFLNEELSVYAEEQDSEFRISVRNTDEEVLSILLMDWGGTITTTVPDIRPNRTEPQVNSFDDLRHAAGNEAVVAPHADIGERFSDVAAALGAFPVGFLMTLSRIVGMRAPGLHSLFSGLDVTFETGIYEGPLPWRVTRHRLPFSPIQLEVIGAGAAAKVDAFVRPSPMKQPRVVDVRKIVTANQFAGQRALVIGGSRGLGEVTAKCITSGGGEVLITYSTGESEAAALKESITEAGGICDTARLDARNLSSLDSKIMDYNPTHIYYFASGPIRNSSSRFNEEAFNAFKVIYVDAFAEIVRKIASETDGKVLVFYPSSVFVTNTPKGFAEYAKAKQLGEDACGALMEELSNLTVLKKRLPALKTDQTMSLLPTDTKPALPAIVEVVEQMSANY